MSEPGALNSIFRNEKRRCVDVARAVSVNVVEDFRRSHLHDQTSAWVLVGASNKPGDILELNLFVKFNILVLNLSQKFNVQSWVKLEWVKWHYFIHVCENDINKLITLNQK